MDFVDKQAEADSQHEKEVAAKKAKALADIPLPENGFRVALENNDGNGYIGVLQLGSEHKPAKLLFDTGSDFLAVTSSLCQDEKLG